MQFGSGCFRLEFPGKPRALACSNKFSHAQSERRDAASACREALADWSLHRHPKTSTNRTDARGSDHFERAERNRSCDSRSIMSKPSLKKRKRLAVAGDEIKTAESVATLLQIEEERHPAKKAKKKAVEDLEASTTEQDENATALRESDPKRKKKKKKKRKAVEAPLEEPNEDREPETPSKKKKKVSKLDAEINEWTSDQDRLLLTFLIKELTDKVKKENDMDWSSLVIEGQSEEACLKRAVHIRGHIRRSKTLQEMYGEALQLFEKDPHSFNYMGGKYSRNKKHKRLIGEPAPPPSAYMLFSKDKVKELQEKFPKENIAFFGKEVGKEWQKINAKKKKHYVRKEREARLKYEKEMSAFLESHPEAKTQKRKLFWPLDAPEKPKTAYALFTKEKKSTAIGKSMKEKKVAIRSMFLKLGEGEKKPYVKRSEQEKERFKTELADYYEAHPEHKDICEQLLGKKSSEEKEEKSPPKKKFKIPFDKPPTTTYLLYSQKRRKDVKMSLKEDEIIQFSAFSKKIGKEWSQLPAEARDELTRELEEMKQTYEEKLSAYIDELADEEKEIIKSQLAKELQPGISRAGFQTFCNSKRVEVTGDFPDYTAAEVRRKLKNMWCEASNEERLRWKNIEEVMSEKRKAIKKAPKTENGEGKVAKEENDEASDDEEEEEEEEESDESEESDSDESDD
eukprot:m.18284 g.18284  ORF g.18284 m.18284 type:complete len:683 (+) comp27634_c0_seq1:876-2924(+)